MDQKHKYYCMDESVVGVEVEVQSVQAIFPDAVTLLPQSRQLTVSHGPNIQLRIQLPVPYPNASPIFQLCAPSMAGEAKRALLAKLEEICAENRGEPMLYPIIDSALAEFASFGEIAGPEKRSKENCDSHEVKLADAPFPAAFHSGQAIEDRKSVFQAHVAKLTSKDQIPELLSQLKAVGKIARARHNPYAWRLVLSGGGDEQQQAGAAAREIEQHDCDDDGEDGSASKLLRLLVQMDARGVLLVVSRWKGGNKIGPERFRHFCNAARDALISGGFVKHGNG